jgi:hypothetical protein
VILIVQPASYSSLLTFTLVDDYTDENRSIKLQIDLCNSSTRHSCRYFLADDQQKENQLLLLWAMSLAVIITCLCVVLFSIMTCLCCRRPAKPEQSSQNLANFLQCHEDGAHSEKVKEHLREETSQFISADSRLFKVHWIQPFATTVKVG